MNIKRLLKAIFRWVFWICFGFGLCCFVLRFFERWYILKMDKLYGGSEIHKIADDVTVGSIIGTFFYVCFISVLLGTAIFILVRTLFLDAKTQIAYNKLLKRLEQPKDLETRLIKNWRDVEKICSNKFDAQIISCGSPTTSQSKLNSRFYYLGKLNRMIDQCSLTIKLYRNKDSHADIENDREKAESEMKVFESDRVKSESLFSKSEVKNRDLYLKENGYTFRRVLCKSLKLYFIGK